MTIKDILTIDLSEDIKNVIDLENVSEKEIQSEIEGYIITDGLAKDYEDFVSTYTSNRLETGVWISGFYGSGKSYFGKLLGYLLSNRMIAGTPTRERILQRFTGIDDEALVKSTLSKLDAINSRVVFLDIAKQDTSKGLAYTLFRNFLHSLELPENEHGFFMYQLMLNDGQSDIHDFVYSHLNKNWNDIKFRLIEYAKTAKEIFIKKGNAESDYDNFITTIRRDIDQFSAVRLKEEISNYLHIVNDEKIVFLFDEASEAINQQKFSLLDLEGISESLSSLGGSVWTIAIAQEKLDDVINNSNVSRAQLTKVTDRFKTKIHLEATEVDVIIRNRLLKKKENGIQSLTNHYKNNSGKILDHASIHGAGISRTDTSENYATYYPFYKYQFDLLQNFLFGTKGYASTKVAARGMIITTYDILKQEMQHAELFNTVTGWHITKEGQPQPSAGLVSRYDNAERILKEANIDLSGRKLLETINFLSEAEVTPPTLSNIVKSHISDPDDYHKTQEIIIIALEVLTEAKILLETNKTYRITSDIEQRLLDEMSGYTVQSFTKKKQLVTSYKNSNLSKTINRISDNGSAYDFYITTDNDDKLTNPALKYLKIKIKSIYNFTDDRFADVETLKVQHQGDKDIIWLIPDNSNFRELDRLIDEVERIGYLKQKYNNSNSEEGRILAGFLTARDEKQNRIKDLVEDALVNSTTIYLYNTQQLNKDNWQSILQTQQKQLLQNVFSKRLSSQLSDSVAAAVIKEANNTRLHQYFDTNDFHFFDTHGNFIGDKLRVVEEILYKTRNTFVDGASLEKDLEIPPTGFDFGSLISTLAALMRSGKVIAKHNGVEKFSWRDDGVSVIFSTAREFRKAAFKAVSKSLSAVQKQQLVQTLLDIEVERFIGRKIDFNTNDFDLANAVRDVAKYFVDKVATLRNSDKDFDKLFPKIEKCKDSLRNHTGAVSEANYIDKAVEFLNVTELFSKSIKNIENVENFIRNSLPQVKEWKTFAQAVNDELAKATVNNANIKDDTAEFNTFYIDDVVKNYTVLQKTVQKIKDEYHSLFSEAMKDCASKYKEILHQVSDLINEINQLPEELNNTSLYEANTLKQYASQRIQPDISFDFDVKDKQSRFTYSEALSFIELYDSKKTTIDIIRAGLIKEKPDENKEEINQDKKTLKTYKTNFPPRTTTVAKYRKWLQQELQKLAGASDNDNIEIE
ncbi:hypothetical protein EZS27_004228 [termite gut metagenome]|uniref:BREX system P-loop protein BrxC n=1 Tax=termite gut metagenome TaxID=433724 RepID=A0A5J4SQZ4_9ZZZZ